MQDAAWANDGVFIEDDVREDRRAGADARTGTDMHAGMDGAARLDNAIVADRSVRININVVGDFRRTTDDRQGADADTADFALRVEMQYDNRKGAMNIVD